MPPDRASLTINFELDSEPIAGSLQHADRSSTEFNGWIQLVSLLQEAATTEAPEADPSANGNPRRRQAR
jgi:hypothetical protein